MTGATAEIGSAAQSPRTLAYVLLGAVVLAGLLALATAPVAALLGASAYAIPATLHGVISLAYVIVATILAYLGFLMFTGRPVRYDDLRLLSAGGGALSTLTILFGNWIYIAYRAPAGPRGYFLETSPALHQVFFEFKEFIALFTLPLAVAAAFVAWREGDGLERDARLRPAVGAVLVLHWLFLLLAFGLGAAITRLRSV